MAIRFTMKKNLLLVVIMMVVSFGFANAQDYKDVIKERKAMAKMTKAELESKASKVARKDAKSYAKEGWKVAPGSLPLEKQLDRTYRMQYEFDDYGNPKYLMSNATAVGNNYDAARMQAIELAKLTLAGQIQTEVLGLVENSVANKQISEEEAASVTETVIAGKNVILQSIGRVITTIECHKDLPNKNKEVRVQIAYNYEMALQMVKDALKVDLEAKGNELHEKLNKALGF